MQSGSMARAASVMPMSAVSQPNWSRMRQHLAPELRLVLEEAEGGHADAVVEVGERRHRSDNNLGGRR